MKPRSGGTGTMFESEPEDRSLLLVEDDPDLSEMLGELLSVAGYDVQIARDGQAGLHHGLTRSYAVMVIDRGLPAIEGVDLIRRLRARGVQAPMLVLTARGTLEDRVTGLDAGAEDYLVKPFEVEELLARLRALLRRHREDSAQLTLGLRHLDVGTRRVIGSIDGPVELSGRECDLLRVLAGNPGRVFGRDELIRMVFPDADGPGAVDTYVYYLRRKLGRDVIHTVHGLGYRMGTT